MYSVIKRLLDIILSFFALAVLSPILIPTCIILLLTGEHEVFYFQERIGYMTRPFNIWKFATMLKNSPNMGSGYITTRRDPRVLPFGRFLRKTKLNELPQLVNILKGDMSIIGPRPMVAKTFEAYPAEIRNRVFDSRPGLSGIGSIIFRDEEGLITRARDPKLFYTTVVQPYKAELEIWYGENKSLPVDCKLVFLTVWVILSPDSRLPYRMFKNLPRKDLEMELERFNGKESPGLG